MSSLSVKKRLMMRIAYTPNVPKPRIHSSGVACLKGLPHSGGEWGRGRGLANCLKLDRCKFSESVLAVLAMMVDSVDPDPIALSSCSRVGQPLPVKVVLLLQEREERRHSGVVSACTKPSR